jgi:hypothetical protein
MNQRRKEKHRKSEERLQLRCHEMQTRYNDVRAGLDRCSHITS